MENAWKHYSWMFNGSEGSIRLPNHRYKVYKYYHQVGVGQHARITFALALNTNKDDTTMELLFKLCDYSNPDAPNPFAKDKRWQPVPVELLTSMFKQENGTWNLGRFYETHPDWGHPNTKVEIVDGHLLIRHSTEWLRNHIGGVAQDTLESSVFGRFIDQYDYKIGFALAFPNVRTIKDAEVVQNAIRELDSVWYRMGDYYSKERKKTLLDRLATYKDELVGYERDFQNMMEQAADAMNILSDKYGVEIEL